VEGDESREQESNEIFSGESGGMRTIAKANPVSAATSKDAQQNNSCREGPRSQFEELQQATSSDQYTARQQQEGVASKGVALDDQEI
jgi:hypothetical protein